MKKLLFLLMMVLMTGTALGQTKRYYCEVKGREVRLSESDIYFDFGRNPVNDWGELDAKQKLVDEKGEEIPFLSMVDAGNYLTDKGWTFLQAYSSFFYDIALDHWIFYKDAATPEEAVKGIMTKDAYKKQQKGE